MTVANPTRRGNRLTVLAALMGSMLAVLDPPARSAETIDFERDVQPIFAEHCLKCHGPKQQESGLRVDDRATLLRGGDLGLPAVVPGKPAESLLLAAVRGDDPNLRMPPEGPPLEPRQIAMLARWIAAGADWPERLAATAETSRSNHWSLQPITRRQVPRPELGWGRNPIDAFIQRKLREHDLSPSPAASPRTLIRRITLDLTGLPPTPAEVEALLGDPRGSDAAYGALIDKLLASPRYGERWAQHWLDVIRWAETVGFETNAVRANAWPYRDWVIAALNADKPFDQFVFEQLAGDTASADAALGFLVAGPANLPGQIGRDEEAMRQARQDELDEVIRTVSQSLLALTIGCARCHNHKFDPITQRDYYAMQAIFAGLAYGERRWRGKENDTWTARSVAVRQQLKSRRRELESVRQRHGLKSPQQPVHAEEFRPVLARAIRMQIAATGDAGPASLYEFEAWSAATRGSETENVALASSGARPSASSFALANQTRHFDNLVDGSVDRRQAFPWVAAKPGPAWLRVDFREPVWIDRVVWHGGSSTPADYTVAVLPPGTDNWHTVADGRDRLPRIDDQRSADVVRLADLSPATVAQIMKKVAEIRHTQRELSRLTAGPQVYAARFAEQPAPTWLLRRGDPLQRVDEVSPAVPAVLRSGHDERTPGGKAPVGTEPRRRLELARHLTRPDHPLTARVIVNRIWQHHFGTGLVETPSDFGEMGARPTHPELLDWLAVELVANGWSLKHLHRLIVASETYRQSSRPRTKALARDADSRLLWRFPPRRLEAEAIRDAILSASGKLNLHMGGPGFDFFDQRGGLSDYSAKQTFAAEGWRRMIYAHKIRMQAVDIFGSFDCPDAGQMKPKRTQSTTPIQSLSLLNSPFANRQATFFAERVRAEVGAGHPAQVDRAVQLALARSPTAAERSRLVELAKNFGLVQVCRVLLNTSEFAFMQ